MQRPTLALIVILTSALTAAPVAAQQMGTDPAADATPAGFLFAYRPHADAQAEFYDGYRAHLSWHRERADSLDWYGWDVLAGPGLGLFVDGVFGTPLAALDERVDPAGDAADAAANVTAYADPVYREVVQLRRDLSTATPLEDRTPTIYVQVVRYTVGPRGLEGLEAAARTVRSEAENRGYLPYTVYENLVGAEPGLVFMVWRDRLGSFDNPERDPTRALHRHLTGAESTADIEVVSEVWRFRRDLTYYGSEETR